MAISAQRFKFLDQETNIGIKDFTDLVDNSVYNTIDEEVSNALSEIQELNSVMGALQSSMGDLTSMLESSSEELMNELKGALDSVVDNLTSLEMPSIISDALESLKELDLGGLKDFFGDMLKVGKNFLCNNLDFMKTFSRGYNLNKNVLEGLIFSLLAQSLDKICKGFTEEEMDETDGLGMLGKMFPWDGIGVDSDNAFGLFKEFSADWLDFNGDILLDTVMSESDFMSGILSGDISSSISNLRNSEISFNLKDILLNNLAGELLNHDEDTEQYSNLLLARGELMNTPMIHPDRIEKNTKYEHLADRFGSYIKNLGQTELSGSGGYGLSGVDSLLYDKMKDLRNLSSTSNILKTIPNDKFSSFDLGSLIPSFDNDESSFLSSLNTTSNSHRVYDLHPTTEVFTEI